MEEKCKSAILEFSIRRSRDTNALELVFRDEKFSEDAFELTKDENMQVIIAYIKRLISNRANFVSDMSMQKLDMIERFLDNIMLELIKSNVESGVKGGVKVSKSPNFGTNEVVQKIMAETRKSEFISRIMANQLNTVHPKLYKVVKAWVKGDEIGYNCNGVTLDDIMKKQKASYVESIFRMSIILESKSPKKVAEQYKTFQFLRG